jgi:hypothetical protein
VKRARAAGRLIKPQLRKTAQNYFFRARSIEFELED